MYSGPMCIQWPSAMFAPIDIDARNNRCAISWAYIVFGQVFSSLLISIVTWRAFW
jgi:hypothetical protein